MTARRNNYDIEADILRVARRGAKKTWIVYRANLNFNIVKEYLRSLIASGCLRERGSMFFTTDKGSERITTVEALRRG